MKFMKLNSLLLFIIKVWWVNYQYLLVIANIPSYKIKDIQAETGWKEVQVRENADLHLSLLSQGLFRDPLPHHYDTNYYYPASAGQGIDLVLLDTGFNFNHPEFSNKQERQLRCVIQIKDGKVVPIPSESYYECGTSNPKLISTRFFHGEFVADAAAGLIHGVASKANVYGVAFNAPKFKNVMAGLKYIRDELIRPHQTVVNLSFGNYYAIHEVKQGKAAKIAEMKQVIQEILEKGAIVVAASGNENRNSYDLEENEMSLPCSISGVICVGGIDTIGVNPTVSWRMEDLSMRTKRMNATHYRKVWWSNYGEVVDLYGPGYIHVAYRDQEGKDWDRIVYGTSFTAPVVSGVIATILGEHPDMTFTASSMLAYLQGLGEHHEIDGIPAPFPNIFVNNGKRKVYTTDTDNPANSKNSKVQVKRDQTCPSEDHCYCTIDSRKKYEKG